MTDLNFLTRLDFCTLFFIAGVAGIAYGIKKKNRLILVVAVATSILFGLMILAGLVLINGIN